MSKHLGRADTQALLDGRPVNGDQPVADVEDFLTAMRTEYGSVPAPAPRPVLASILDGRRPLRTVPEPIAAETERPAAWTRWKRPLRPAAVVFATGTVLFGGLATAGALPAPVQRATADLGRHVGLDLPRPSEPAPAPVRIEPDVPRSGDGGSPARPSGSPGKHPSGTSGSSRGPSSGTPGAPDFPSLPLPVPVPLPVPGPGGPAPLGDGLGSDLGLGQSTLLPGVPVPGLIPDLPNVPEVLRHTSSP